MVVEIEKTKESETYVQIFDLSDPEEKIQYMAVLDYLVKHNIDIPIISKGNIRIIQFKGQVPPRFKDLNLEQFSVSHLPPRSYYNRDSFMD